LTSYYGTVDTNVASPCNVGPSSSEDWNSDSQGLDNDGDLFRGGADRASSTIHAIVHSPTPTIRRPPRPVPPAYDRIVYRCLEKNPDARYQSCREVSTELRLLRRRLIGSPTTRTLAWARTHPIRAAALAAAVVAAAVACAVLAATG